MKLRRKQDYWVGFGEKINLEAMLAHACVDIAD